MNSVDDTKTEEKKTTAPSVVSTGAGESASTDEPAPPPPAPVRAMPFGVQRTAPAIADGGDVVPRVASANLTAVKAAPPIKVGNYFTNAHSTIMGSFFWVCPSLCYSAAVICLLSQCSVE